MRSSSDSVYVSVWDSRAARASGLFWIAVPNSRAVAERTSIGAWSVMKGWNVSVSLWIREPSWARARPQS